MLDGRQGDQVVHDARGDVRGARDPHCRRLEIDGQLDPVQQGFHEKHALHCGFCTPGMMMASRALLDANPNPSNEEIRTAISGGICRCTGYMNIVAAVRWADEHEASTRQEA